MDIELTPVEARIIGCLIEKEKTTPDQYPLSINSLANACNQKSSREPVMNLTEGEVQAAMDALVKKRLVSEASGFGARVVKYQHRFCNTEFGTLKLTRQELGIVCLLLLRGAQTPGELRSRTNRLCEFSDVHEVEQVLQRMMEREDGPLVVRLPREPGKRESRYAHLFSGEVDVEAFAASSAPSMGGGDSDERITLLEQEVAELRAEVAELKQQLAELL